MNNALKSAFSWEVNDMYSLDDFIRKNDTEYKVKKAIIDCLVKNMTEEVAIEILSNDLQKRLYDFIYTNEELSIDDGSNVERDFKKTIKDILLEYFNS